MIVLRHSADDPTRLHIYYSPQGTRPIYYNIIDTNIQYDYIDWSSSVSVSNPLILGGNLNASGNIENTQNGLRNATGTVFFAKYWEVDLGVDDCSKLARWPHEQIGYRTPTTSESVGAVIASKEIYLQSEKSTLLCLPIRSFSYNNE